jgi:hypothetical protein
MNKLLKWVYLTLSIATLVIRFLYGTKYEMKNEEFNISLTGIILTLLAVIFFILFAISNSKSNDKNVE